MPIHVSNKFALPLPRFPLPPIEEKLVRGDAGDLFGKWVGEKLLSPAKLYNLIHWNSHPNLTGLELRQVKSLLD